MTSESTAGANCYVALLEQEALLRVVGPDAARFLQGQTTCDTRKLGPEQALPGAYCSPQGRVCCDFLLSQVGEDSLALRMRADILESSAATFAKYIIFSKAELVTSREGWQVLGCWGEGARALLERIFPTLPDSRFGACTGPGYTLVQLDAAGSQFECYLHRQAGRDYGDRLLAAAEQVPESRWQLLSVAAGIARVEAATVGEFIPQMLNFDVTGHVSFDKGCYTGQEVVARLHYRGKPKRRLYPGTLASEVPPAPGSALYTPGSAQSTGTIVNSVQDDGGRVAVLAVATVALLDQGLQLAAAGGPQLELGELPYPLPPA